MVYITVGRENAHKKISKTEVEEIGDSLAFFSAAFSTEQE